MSAHAYASPAAPEGERQPRLFALPGGTAVDSPQRPVARPLPRGVAGAERPTTRPAMSGGVVAAERLPTRAELPGPATVAAAALALAPAAAPVARRPLLAAVPAPAPLAEPEPSTVREIDHARATRPRTLDGELRLAWTAITAGAPAACFMCGGRMEPLAHGHGGACTSCGTTLE